MDAVFLIGRILIAQVFIGSGLGVHFKSESVEYARAMGAPAPALLVPLSGVVIIAGGLMIGLGIWADLGALLVIGFLIGITPLMHAFWKIDDPMERANQQAQFFKNVGLIGAAAIVFWLYNQIQGEAPLSITDPLFSRAD